VFQLQEIFSNRELSSIIWIVLIILGFQFNKPTRQATGNLLKAYFVPSILTVNVLAVLYSSSIIYLLFKLNFWNQTLLKDTMYWFTGSGFLILLNINKANKERDFFKNILIDNLKLILILEFIVNIHQFGLVTEFILVPILAFLGVLQVVAEREERTEKLKVLIEWIFAIFGIIVLGFSIRDVWVDFHGFTNISRLESFLLPIILSITFIPIAYIIALYMNFEMLFVRLGFFLTNKKDLRYAKWRVILKSRLSLKKLNAISPKINALYNSSTRQDIRDTIF
jgi:hypothetical protein